MLASKVQLHENPIRSNVSPPATEDKNAPT